MIIKKLKWISEVAKEAELVVSDGVNECLAFSQPFTLPLDVTLKEPLHAVDVENFMKVDSQNKNEKIIKLDDSYFSQYCVASILNREDSIVSVGGILIQLDMPIPGWAYEGDLVEFKCSRLDVW